MISVNRCTLSIQIKSYTPLVRRLAHQFIAKLPANVELDDLVQVGLIGLSEALDRFDTSHGVMFETFATQRIRGAMLDCMRQDDWMSRGDRRQSRKIEAAMQALGHQLGRAPYDREIATHMDMSLLEFQELKAHTHGAGLTYLEDMANPDDLDDAGENRFLSEQQGDPVAILEDKLRREKLVEAIGNLPERLQYVMRLYYEHDLSFQAIADILKVTESRACQLHKEALAKIRVKVAIPTKSVRFTPIIVSSNQADYGDEPDLIIEYVVPR